MPEKIEPIRYVTVSDASGSTLSGSDLAQMSYTLFDAHNENERPEVSHKYSLLFKCRMQNGSQTSA